MIIYAILYDYREESLVGYSLCTPVYLNGVYKMKEHLIFKKAIIS